MDTVRHMTISHAPIQWKIRYSTVAGFFILAAAVTIVYGPTIGYEFTNWDDPAYVLNNHALRVPGWPGLKKIFTQSLPPAHGDYLPITILSYWLDYRWWGFDPHGYHLTNVILHMANTGLLFFLLIQLTAQPVESLLIALLCSLHPVNTEVVAWIAERKSLLAMFWMLVSFLFFLNWQRNQHSSLHYFSVSLFCYLLACLSKTAAVFFPLLLLAYQLCLQKKPFRYSLATITPFVLLSVATAIIRIAGHAASGQMDWHPFATLWIQLLTIVKLFGQYLVTLFLPVNLNNSYPLETARAVFDPGVLSGILSLAGMLIIMLRSFRAAAGGR